MTESPIFEYEFDLRWADLDPNGHVRHTVFLDLCAQARMRALEDVGFDMGRMTALGVGPILFAESAQYLLEAHVHDRLQIDVELTGMSENRKHFAIRHRIRRHADREVCAVIDCRGAWFDQRTRRVVPAPDELFDKVDHFPRSDDYQTITGQRPGWSDAATDG